MRPWHSSRGLLKRQIARVWYWKAEIHCVWTSEQKTKNTRCHKTTKCALSVFVHSITPMYRRSNNPPLHPSTQSDRTSVFFPNSKLPNQASRQYWNVNLNQTKNQSFPGIWSHKQQESHAYYITLYVQPSSHQDKQIWNYFQVLGSFFVFVEKSWNSLSFLLV